MFCPNCGNDCGDANYCPNCGEKIIPSNGDIPVSIQEPPIGIYKGNDGYVEVSFHTLTIHKELPFETVEKLISFREVKEVRFHPAKALENGFLAIREWDEVLPVSETEWDAVADETALTFDERKNDEFLKVYVFLSCCKEVVQTKARLISEVRSICPKCKSSSIRNRIATVPVAHPIADEYICCSCGYQWNAESLLKRQTNGNIQRECECLDQFPLEAGSTVEKSEHNRNKNLICCPCCKSSKYFVHEKQRRRVFMSGKSPVLALWMIVLYICEKCFAKRTEYVCLDCGHTWEN